MWERQSKQAQSQGWLGEGRRIWAWNRERIKKRGLQEKAEAGGGREGGGEEGQEEPQSERMRKQQAMSCCCCCFFLSRRGKKKRSQKKIRWKCKFKWLWRKGVQSQTSGCYVWGLEVMLLLLAHGPVGLFVCACRRSGNAPSAEPNRRLAARQRRKMSRLPLSCWSDTSVSLTFVEWLQKDESFFLASYEEKGNESILSVCVSSSDSAPQ